MDITDFMTRIAGAVENLARLEITTRVGPTVVTIPPADQPGGVKVSFPGDPAPKVMYTRVDLVECDVFRSVDEGLLDDKYKDVRDLHKCSEQMARDMVDKNIDTLKKLVDFALSLRAQRGAATPPAKPGA